MWIKRSPIIFLVLSVACFFLDLILFAYSSQQVIFFSLIHLAVLSNTDLNKSRVTSTLTAVLSATCCFGLTAMPIWFAFERWIFNWHDGNKLLSDVLTESARGLLNVRIVAWSLDQYRRMEPFNKRVASRSTPVIRSIKKILSRILYTTETVVDVASTTDDSAILNYPLEPITPDLEAQNTPVGHTSEQADHPPLSGKERFKRTVHKVMVMQRMKVTDPSTVRSRTGLRPVLRNSRRHHTGMSDINTTVPSGISGTLVPRLKNLEVVQKLDVHTGLVRDMQFSPDGKYLATARRVKSSLYVMKLPI